MQIFWLVAAHIKIYQICHVIFGTKSQFFFKLCIIYQCHERYLFCTFSSKTLYAIKVQIIRLSTARMKTNQIPYVIFQDTSQSSFKFYITFQCHDTKFLWNFLAELLGFGQKEPIKVQILRLLCALMKVHPIPHASFETTRSRFIEILHHCSVSWKITQTLA